MDFSIEEFEEVVRNIEEKLDGLDSQLASVPGIVQTGISHWWVTDGLEVAIKWAGETIVDFLTWLLETVRDLLKGVVAPVYMALCAGDWLDIRSSSSQVAANVDPNVLASTGEWQGAAQFAYRAAATAHNAAAKRISDISKDATTTLIVSAAAGLTFYAVILGVLVKAAMAVTVGLGGIASGVFSWAGAALIVEEAITDSAAIAAAIAGLTALLTAQVTTMAGLEATATDNSTWPNGKWPDAATSTFDNGTRLDGTAEWSIR
ncbi:hypothetical protein [Nocardia farcinica]|uniref:hypothetical protein n=1 Tax=Nocardia farcinica TaxID=37329 RepID=UPI001893A700|nr:hypothetical protein [Nocardia farcinica]MBF6371644.1 hypothetical protein [Nocardia farcinica]